MAKSDETIYIYRWGNNKDAVGRFRRRFKGRKCRIVQRGKMNSVLIEFIDNKERLNTSRNALRKVGEIDE